MTNSPSGAPFAQAAQSSLFRFAGTQAGEIGQRAAVDGQRGVLARLAPYDQKSRYTTVFGNPGNAVSDPRKAFREVWAKSAMKSDD